MIINILDDYFRKLVVVFFLDFVIIVKNFMIFLGVIFFGKCFICVVLLIIIIV